MTNQNRALTALLESNSLTEAAEKAGISRRTLYEYIHNNVDFARAFDEARNRQIVGITDILTDRVNKAYDVIMDILQDPEQPAAIRLRAAQTIISSFTEQEQIVAQISKENISANKEMFDFSVR